MMGKTIIVGGSGFLGSSLAAALQAAGRKVTILDTSDRLKAGRSRLSGAALVPLEFPRLDGLDQALSDADELIHLACTTTPASSMASLAYDAETNIAPSVAIFEAAKRAGIRRVLFSSSGGTVYGNPKAVPVSEEQAGSPLSGYGVSKLCIESYLGIAAEMHGFDGVSLRIGNPYGSYQLAGSKIGVIARYLSEVHADNTIEVWGDGSVVRDYLYIDDITSAVVAILNAQDIPSGPYNIGSGNGVSINEIISTIFRVTGRRVDVSYKPARGFDVDSIVLDPAKIRTATGWSAKISLIEGIDKLWRALHEI